MMRDSHATVDKIKWKRLKNISSRITGKTVDIFLSTVKVLNGYNALIEYGESSIKIFINGNVCKDINSIIDAIAHELAHSTTGEQNDNEIHAEAWERIREKITTEYHSI
jgi:hypothetical protein